jgi:hypothetical protein
MKIAVVRQSSADGRKVPVWGADLATAFDWRAKSGGSLMHLLRANVLSGPPKKRTGAMAGPEAWGEGIDTVIVI